MNSSVIYLFSYLLSYSVIWQFEKTTTATTVDRMALKRDSHLRENETEF